MTLMAPPRAGSADSGTAVSQTAGESARLIPALQLHVRRIPWQIGRYFVRQHHYLHDAPPLGRVAFGVFASDAPITAFIGAILYGQPAARLEDQESTLELRRMVILDVTERNAESRCIGYTVRWIRRQYPGIRRLIAYADPSVGHEGTIYKASGWRLTQRREGSCGDRAWASRVGRIWRLRTAKLKYEKVIR